MKIVPIAFVAVLLFTCCAFASLDDYTGEVVCGTCVSNLSFTEDYTTTLSSQTSCIAPPAIKPIQKGSDKVRPVLAINGRAGPVPAAIVSLGTSALLETVVTSGQTAVIESNVPFTSTISPDVTVTAVSTVTISTAIATMQIATITSLSTSIPEALSDTLPSTTFPTFTFAFPTSSTSIVLPSSHVSTPNTPNSIASRPSSTSNSVRLNTPSSTLINSMGSTELSQPSSIGDSSLSMNVALTTPTASMTLATTSPGTSIETSRPSTTGVQAASSIASTGTKTSTLLTTTTMYSTTLTTTRTINLAVSSSTISTIDTVIVVTISATASPTSFTSVSPLSSNLASSFMSFVLISTGLQPGSLRTTATATNEPNTTTSSIMVMSTRPVIAQGPTSTGSTSETSVSSASGFTVTITETQSVCGSGSINQIVIATSLTANNTISNEHYTSKIVVAGMTYISTMSIDYHTLTSFSLAYATTGTSNVPIMPWMETQSASAVSSMNATSTQTPLAYTGAASHEADQFGKFAFWVGFVALAFLH